MRIGERADGLARAREGRRGAVMVMALFVLTSLMVLGVGMYTVAGSSVRAIDSGIDDQRARYLAEAGLAEAMVALRSGASGGVASAAAPAYQAGGVLWVTSTDLGGNQFRLVSTALAGKGRAAMEAIVEREDQVPLFSTVLNSKETLTLNSGVAIDSFDSELGTYASQVVNSHNGIPYAADNGDVSSNQGIVLNANAATFGDATPGPGYGVSFGAGSYVSGSTAPAPTTFSFPTIQAPTVSSSGPMTVPANGSQTIPSGTHGFDDLTLNKSSTLLIQGPATLVVNNFTGGKDARLQIDANNGPVTIFVQGDYSHLSNFEAVPVNNSPMAVAFMVQGTGDIVFPASSKIRGAYYVPNADVTFTSSNEAWGSFGANRIDMSASMRFHYDETLSKHWDTDGSSGKDPLRLLVWRRSQVTPDALLRDRRDPFQLLQLNKNALPAPSATWAP